MARETNIIEQLEHDHHIVERIVDDLREAIQNALRGELEVLELRDTFSEFVSVADEELFEHFDREEQVVFPFLIENVPDAQDSIRRLENAHDRMCGAMIRMQRIIEEPDDALFTENFDSLVALFTRFDANFGRHSREELALFHKLGEQLGPEELETLKAMLAEL